MRRKYLTAAVVYALPLANAFSLANFQAITSGLIPAGCALAYNSQIPICDSDDFNQGCSKNCRNALKTTGSSVQMACFGLIVNSRSLLGIVQAGGIVGALCVKGDDAGGGGGAATSTTMRITTTSSRPPVQATTSKISVVVPPSSIRTSTTTSASSAILIPSSTLQTSIQEPTQTSSILPPVTIIGPTTALLIPTNANSLPPIPTTTRSSSAAPASTTRPATGGQGGGGSGGGSPFDIVNQNGGSYLERNSLMSALVLGGWAFVIFG